MSKEILIALAAGGVAGVFYGSLATGSMGGMVLAYLSQVPLFFAGLMSAWRTALVAGAAATVVVAGIGGLLSAGLFLLTNAGPTVLLVRQALLNRRVSDGAVEWYPPGLLMAWLAAIPAVGLIIAWLLMLDQEGGLEGAVSAFLAAFVKSLESADAGVDTAKLQSGLAAVLPGLAACSWMFMATVNGALAQGLLVGFRRNRRPSPRLADLVLPPWLLYALAGSLLIAVVADGGLGYIARNLALLFAVPFFFQGLGVVHALIARLKARMLALVLFYLVLVVLGWSAFLVVMLGVAEPFVGIRARLARRPPRQENE